MVFASVARPSVLFAQFVCMANTVHGCRKVNAGPLLLEFCIYQERTWSWRCQGLSLFPPSEIRGN